MQPQYKKQLEEQKQNFPNCQILASPIQQFLQRKYLAQEVTQLITFQLKQFKKLPEQIAQLEVFDSNYLTKKDTNFSLPYLINNILLSFNSIKNQLLKNKFPNRHTLMSVAHQQMIIQKNIIEVVSSNFCYDHEVFFKLDFPWRDYLPTSDLTHSFLNYYELSYTFCINIEYYYAFLLSKAKTQFYRFIATSLRFIKKKLQNNKIVGMGRKGNIYYLVQFCMYLCYSANMQDQFTEFFNLQEEITFILENHNSLLQKYQKISFRKRQQDERLRNYAEEEHDDDSNEIYADQLEEYDTNAEL